MADLIGLAFILLNFVYGVQKFTEKNLHTTITTLKNYIFK